MRCRILAWPPVLEQPLGSAKKSVKLEAVQRLTTQQFGARWPPEAGRQAEVGELRVQELRRAAAGAC